MTEQTNLAEQRTFWNRWNAAFREQQESRNEVSIRQQQVVADWLANLRRHDLDIIEVGCGAGWLSPTLVPYGRVTATDLADELIERARERHPEVRFVAGDFMQLDLPAESFDVIVTLEVLSHVADQRAFITRLATLLRDGGRLMMATQNRTVLERFNDVPPPEAGQLRHWVDRDELRRLVLPDFEILELFTVTPRSNRGFMRFVNSKKVNRPIRWIAGDRLERLKERRGLGWTLMLLAAKRT